MRRRTKRVLWWYGAGAVALLIAGAGVRAILEQVSWWTPLEAGRPEATVVAPSAGRPRTGWTRAPTYQAPTPAATSSLVAPPPLPPPAPSVSVSDTAVEQSDTFVVSVMDVPTGTSPTAAWNDRTYDLFRVGNKWLGLLGADAKKLEGNYSVTIRIGTTTLAKAISIAKRLFPVTLLTVTPELEEAGYTPPAIQSNVATENERLNSALIYTPEARFSRSFVNPLDRISIVGAYGNIRKSGTVELQHLGVDLDAAEGTPVYATNDGVVRLVENFVNYGKTIVVDHGVGIFSFYLHLNEFNVKVGDTVARGVVIARSGNTGYSIGPHLHFSVRIRNASVDPLRFIETANKALAVD